MARPWQVRIKETSEGEPTDEVSKTANSIKTGG